MAPMARTLTHASCSAAPLLLLPCAPIRGLLLLGSSLPRVRLSLSQAGSNPDVPQPHFHLNQADGRRGHRCGGRSPAVKYSRGHAKGGQPPTSKGAKPAKEWRACVAPGASTPHRLPSPRRPPGIPRPSPAPRRVCKGGVGRGASSLTAAHDLLALHVVRWTRLATALPSHPPPRPPSPISIPASHQVARGNGDRRLGRAGHLRNRQLHTLRTPHRRRAVSERRLDDPEMDGCLL